MKTKKIVLLFALILTAHIITAQDESEVTASGELFMQISSVPEVKIGYTHRFIFPFLQGGNPLTEGNNINLSLTAEATPISVNALLNAVWTPIAFIELAAGGRVGSGWHLKLFDDDIYGIGLNVPGAGGKAEYEGSDFDALLWKLHFGGAFQFDLAAIFPGDWNHVVFRTYHEINYHANTRAKKDQSWYYEGGDGENCNGFNYYGNFLLGYQMPIFLNMIAVMTEMDLYLYDTPGRKDWGDDLIRWHISGVLNFKISEKFEIMTAVQFRTRRNFIQQDWEDLYYRFRTVDTSNPQSLEFYRVAAVLTYRL